MLKRSVQDLIGKNLTETQLVVFKWLLGQMLTNVWADPTRKA